MKAIVIILIQLILLAQVYDIWAATISLGQLTNRVHGVTGEVVLLSDRVLEIRSLTYDGAAPSVFFWADTKSYPDDKGFVLLDGMPSNYCGTRPLSSANGKSTYRVEFPYGKSIYDVQGGSISLWCRAYAANLGEVVIPKNLSGLTNTTNAGLSFQCDAADETSPISLGKFPSLAHQVGGQVVIISDRILEVRGFQFDGAAPDTFFWADTSYTPTRLGFVLLETEPQGSCGRNPLIAADGSQVYRLEFPVGKSIRSILGGSIAVWCRSFGANFGHIQIPTTLRTIPNTTQNALKCSGYDPILTPSGYNCEPLNDNFQVRWKVLGTDVAIELIGRIQEGHYMGFGPSGSRNRTLMDGADAVIGDYFRGTIRARDHYMISRGQCSNADGVCPDTSRKNLTNDVRAVSGVRINEKGITLVRYIRPLRPIDAEKLVNGIYVDQSISLSQSARTYIVWAIGPTNNETGHPNFHSVAYPRKDVWLEFGRTVKDNCIPLDKNIDIGGTDPALVKPFDRPVLKGVTKFNAVIGPSGGDSGYLAITGRTSWGIAWYINDYIIPEIELRRGTKYTFRVNGGNTPSSTSVYHPFYITTSISGGYAQLSPTERLNETVFAGITITRSDPQLGVLDYKVTAAGPLCSYEYTSETESSLNLTYAKYFATLNTSCAKDPSIANKAAVLEFTPDKNTPDVIYYHCVTHRNLGWKIRVVDAKEESYSMMGLFRRLLNWILRMFKRKKMI